MKVTAIIPNDLVRQVQQLSKGKNITDSLIIALQDWASQQKLKRLNAQIKKSPLIFSEGFSAISVRKSGRK